ncbi:MAG: glycerophosphoryl diester phosphodiesterase, glycerophosphoryl diester phosphodiesterase [Candidatus Saccharibacteria bacterium]|nr:glycerophosphoryl diester phosphodiesterase, glycerophosphoryl diester phosphodiesterase [Candidatus Saccharibacteria bacterium]MDB5181383.1 glycerophosphoryl diester phosphodiesterase, glycerophosphoryl diester phosphodiesterase [Candidatus Saccharibacteria bacterium]
MQIIAHRGASGYKPENTLSSFQEAISLGVDIIELDVFVIKTGEVVVFHDETVDRTTHSTGKVTDFSLEELRQLDAGNGEKIPLLSEVLDLIDKRIPINIEMKGNGIARPVANLIRDYVTKKGWSDRHFIVSSSNYAELKLFARLRPSVRVGTLFRGEPPYRRVLAKDDNAFSANLAAEFVTDESVREAHSRGLKVYAYTVNSKREARRLKSLKVDGVFTDYPDKILAEIT